jgi:hypothetical protein
MRRHSAALWVCVGCAPEYELAQPVDVDPADILPCDFTPIDGTALHRYDCNPVFTGTEEPWSTGLGAVTIRAQEVVGHPVYQLWYTSPPLPWGGGWAMGHAISADGVTWTPHPANPLIVEEGGWDASSMDQLSVTWDLGRREYVLTYQGYRLGEEPVFGVGVLTSDDGVLWASPIGRYPMIDLAVSVDGRDYCWPLSVRHDGREFLGFIAGHDGDEQACSLYSFVIPEITEPFALNTTLALAAGPEAVDRAGIASASAIQLADGRHLLFYVGFDGWESVQDGVIRPSGHQLALATSPDGLRWTKDPANPLPIAEASPRHVTAQAIGSRVQLWVTADDPVTGQRVVSTYLFDPEPAP